MSLRGVRINSLTTSNVHTATVCVPAQREYNFPQFKSVSELIQYADCHVPSMDSGKLKNFLFMSSSVTKKLSDGVEFQHSSAMKTIVSILLHKFASEDSNTAAGLFQAVSRFVASTRDRPRVISPCLTEIGKAFSHLMTSSHCPIYATLHPSNFAFSLKSLYRVGTIDSQLSRFVETVLPSYIPNMNTGDCNVMLQVLKELDIRQHDLYRLLGERLIEQMDQFSSRDVIWSLKTFARTGYSVSLVLKRCSEVLSESPDLFDARDLPDAAEALLQLNTRLEPSVLKVIQKRVNGLGVYGLSTTLRVLCASSIGEQSEFANRVVGLLASSSVPKFLACEVTMAYAICTFNIQDRKLLLQKLINSFLHLDIYPPFILSRLIEVLESAQRDFDLQVEIPQRLLHQVDELYAKQEDGGYEIQVKTLIEKLPIPYQLSVHSKMRVGPFMPSLVDTTHRVAIDVYGNVQGKLRYHLYDKLGYSYIVIPIHRLRRTKEENGKIELLKKFLGPTMVKLGRMSVLTDDLKDSYVEESD